MMSDDEKKQRWMSGFRGLADPETRRACLAIKELGWAGSDDRLRVIAAALRNGCANPVFLGLLAQQIDPDVDWPSSGTKLVVSRPHQRHAPKRKPDARLEAFLTAHIDVFGEKVEAVFAEAKARFGASRTKCAETLKKSRETRKFYRVSEEKMRERAHEARRRGDPDYQPLSG